MRIKLLQLVLFFFCSSVVYSQSAPNFTVTDSNGEEHRLHEDYLDKDKTVLLKIFFTSCPPCNQIAPHIQSLYEEWGSGNYDIQFLELSVMSWDNNTLINNYVNKHDISFPSAGAEGGSVEATEPYRSGDFGLYTGTPTFVVIAPDRTVNFDVTGFGTQGQLDALEAAFTAAGAQKPSTTPVIGQTLGKNEVKIVPNPFLTQTQIHVTTVVPGVLTYELFDIIGNKIESDQRIISAAGTHMLNQNYNTLRAGTYIVRLSLNGSPIKSLKMIKEG